MAVEFSDVKTIVSKLYKEITGNEFRNNSFIEEAFIDPLAELLTPLVSDISDIKGEVNLTELSTKSEDVVDLIASNLVQTRISGGKSYGYIRIYLNESVDFSLSKDTLFSTSKGLNFELDNSVIFSKDQLTYDELKNAYVTPNILVRAQEEGAAYSVAANSINQISVNIPSIVDVVNEDAFTVVLDKETNDAFVERIKNSISSQSLDSGKGIRYLLSTYFSGLIGDVYTAGFRDKNMTRDKIHVFNQDNKLSRITSNLNGKTDDSTQNKSLVFKNNDRFLMTGSIDEFIDELETSEYNRMYFLDAIGFELTTKNIFADEFTGSSLDSVWRVTETGYPLGNIRDRIYSKIESGQLVLGGKVEKSVVLKDDITQQIKKNFQAAFPTLDVNKIPNMNNIEIDLNNFSPVVNTDIGYFNNIVITGSFITDDDGDETRPLYVTVCRNMNEEEQAYAHDGFGFAVMVNQKDNGPNVFIVDNNYNDSSLNGMPGSAQMTGDQLINTKNIYSWLVNGQTEILPNREYFYEMTISLPHSYKGYDYLSDDDKVSTLELRIWGNDDENKGSRGNAFLLKLGAYIPHNVRPFYLTTDEPSDNIIPIEASIGYYLGLEYWYNDGSLKNYPKGTAITNTVIENLKRYGWVNNEVTQIKQVEIQLTQNPLEDTSELRLPKYELNPLIQIGAPTGFGFGLLETGGHEWRLGAVEVSRLTHGFSQLLFKMDITNVYNEGDPSVNIFGKYKCVGGVEDAGFINEVSGGNIFIYDNVETSFDLSPIHTYSDIEGYVSFNVDVDLKDNNILTEGNSKYIYLLVTPKYRSGQSGINRQESVVDVSYLEVSKEFDSVSTGNAMDVYFASILDKYNPTNDYEVTIPYISSQPIDLTTALGVNLPIYEVYEIVTIDSNGTNIATLEPGTDFSIHHIDESLIGSVKERPQLLIYTGVGEPNIKIRYRAYDKVKEVQTFFDSSEYKVEDFDILAKHKRIINVSLELNSNLSTEELIDELKEYIYKNIIVNKLQILNIVISKGATKVPLEDIKLEYSYINAYGNTITTEVIDEFKIKETDINIPTVVIHPIQ